MYKSQTDTRKAGQEYLSQSVIALLLLIIGTFCWLGVFGFQYHSKGWAFWVISGMFYGTVILSVVISVRTIKRSRKLFKSEKRLLNYLAFGISTIVLTLIIAVFLTVLINQWIATRTT
jgi:uncharacterized membrane protein